MLFNKKIKLGILISGKGSNMHSLIKACQNKTLPAEVMCVITDNSKATGLKIAKQAGISTFVVEGNPLDTNQIHAILLQHKVDLICLAGFMKILKANFLKKWRKRVINIHPSLLPSFKGLNAQEQALKAGVKITGCTVHYVTSKIDNGMIIHQIHVPVLPNDNIQSLSQRILEKEHKCYIEAVRIVASNLLKK